MPGTLGYGVAGQRSSDRPETMQGLARPREVRVNRKVEIVDFPATSVAAVEYQGAPGQEHSAIRKLVAWRRENGVACSRDRLSAAAIIGRGH